MKGPENADQAQLEMLRKIQRRTNIDDEFSGDSLSRDQGQLSWKKIEGLFSKEALQEFSQGKAGSKQQEKVPAFRALDQIYDSLKTTYSGNPKLEGIRSINTGADTPVSKNSFRHWRKSYDKQVSSLIQARNLNSLMKESISTTRSSQIRGLSMISPWTQAL